MKKVLARNITNLEDARYFAARMVEWMVISPPDDKDMALSLVKGISEWIEGPSLAIPYSSSVSLQMLSGEKLCKGALYTESEFYSERLSGVYSFLELDLDPEKSEKSMQKSLVISGLVADAIILNGRIYGVGSDHLIFKNILRSTYEMHVEVWLDLGLTFRDIKKIGDQYPDVGLVVYGRDKTGLRDFDELDSFFNSIE